MKYKPETRRYRIQKGMCGNCGKRKKDTPLSSCQKCRESSKKWRDNHKDRLRENNERWIKNNRDRYSYLITQRWKSLKSKVLSAYGEKCVCCKEKEPSFLAIDHITGATEREISKFGGKAGGSLYGWLVSENYPEGYRILCHNCNAATRRGKVCPHKTKTP